MKSQLKVLKLLLGASHLLACSESQEEFYPIYQPLTESVYSSVIIEPVGFYKVYATTQGVIEEIFVEEGDRLQKNDTILTIVDEPSSYQRQNAALELNLAQENFQGKSNLIKDLENDFRIAQLKYKNDSVNFERQSRLWEKKIGSKNEMEQRKLAFETSKNKMLQIQNQIIRRKEELKIGLLKAQNFYKSNRFQNEEYVIKSKIDGRVYELIKEKGELVSLLEPMAYIGSADSFLIRMQVDEVDIVKIKSGQEVWVSLDAYENQVFEAVVAKIIPKMSQETQTFWVEGVFKAPPKVLYSGLRGEASIVIQKKQSTLTIPIQFLLTEDQVKTESGSLRVETGLKGMEWVEILSGLDTNTSIFKP